MSFTFGSVCSGIEAASVAWHPLGWRAAWLAEIEPFPSAVLAHHYPDVLNVGDMATIPGLVDDGLLEAPDVFCGGTPCQAFSVAGLRRSLDDARGNLSLVFCEIANAIDRARAAYDLPASIVFWENVPGVLNTKDNAFGCFLAGLAGEDEPLQPAGARWTDCGVVLGPARAVAWRVLDAQYFGLAQRRRRVFVVASARDDFDPVAVLLESDGVRRDSAPRREAGEGTAQCLTAGTGKRYDPETETILPHGGVGVGLDFQNCAETGDLCGTLMGEAQKKAGQAGHGVLAFHHNAQAAQLPSADRDTSISDSLTCSQQAAVAFSSKDYGADATTELAPTLRAMTHADSHANGGGQMAVAQFIRVNKGRPDGRQSAHTEMVSVKDRVETLTTDGHAQSAVFTPAMQVRRLTPRECERLQGFPDDYTLIPWRKKPAAECPDGPRYKALGNSWAVPVVRWVGERIHAQVFGDIA